MEKRVVARKQEPRNQKLRDIVDKMDIADVETIYNTMQRYFGDAFEKIGILELGSAVGITSLTFLQHVVNEPDRVLFLAACDILYSLPFFFAALKRSKYKADHEELDRIADECFGVTYDELSFGTGVRLYVNSKRRLRQEQRKAKVKRK